MKKGNKIMTYYQIRGIVGSGYRFEKEVAMFNPRTQEWESREMDSSRYDISNLSDAELLLKEAMKDKDVSEIELTEYEYEGE